jgi:hypothetical protein
MGLTFETSAQIKQRCSSFRHAGGIIVNTFVLVGGLCAFQIFMCGQQHL